MPNIIAGKYKRTKIEVPSKLVRPTSALKREAIFSILESYFMQNSIDIYKDKSIIDIFAGSGLIGLEAVSRGMKKCYFIENDESVFKALKRNCDKICKPNEYEIIFEKAIIGIEKKFEIEPSIIFIDPPYKEIKINMLIEKIIYRKLLKKDGILIIHRHKKDKVLITEKINILDTRTYGVSKVYFAN